MITSGCLTLSHSSALRARDCFKASACTLSAIASSSSSKSILVFKYSPGGGGGGGAIKDRFEKDRFEENDFENDSLNEPIKIGSRNKLYLLR